MPIESRQDVLYEEAIAAFGAALVRLAQSYEADADKRKDLLQEIHVALWRSLDGFDSRCSLRTWVYRVAHNVAASHVIRDRRLNSRNLVSLETLEGVACEREAPEATMDRRNALKMLSELILKLRPLDRQIMLLYLEGSDAASIGEITGVSPGNIATKIHRIKRIIADRFWKEVHHDE